MLNFGTFTPRTAALLAVGFAITLIGSLSIHVVMLQGLGVAFPDNGVVPKWAAVVNTVLSIGALAAAFQLARPALHRSSIVAQGLAVSIVYAGLKETLRGAVMNAVVTTAWAFNLAKALSPLVYSLSVGFSVAYLLASSLRPSRKLVGVFLLGLAAPLIIRPLVGAATDYVLQPLAGLDHAEIYTMPYGWQVLVPAYLTYIEPVAASFLLAALIWPRLGGGVAMQLAQFGLIVALIKGVVLPTLVFSLFLPMSVPQAMLSEGQFLLEALGLAFLTGLTLIGTSDRNRPMTLPPSSLES